MSQERKKKDRWFSTFGVTGECQSVWILTFIENKRVCLHTPFSISKCHLMDTFVLRWRFWWRDWRFSWMKRKRKIFLEFLTLKTQQHGLKDKSGNNKQCFNTKHRSHHTESYESPGDINGVVRELRPAIVSSQLPLCF